MKAILRSTTALSMLLAPCLAYAQTPQGAAVAAQAGPARPATTLPTDETFAQVTEPQTGAASQTGGVDTAQGAEQGGLADIVVTAQRRSENLQNVPITINAATGADLVSRGVTSTSQLSVISPGVQVNETAGSFQPSIRGIGTSSTVAENPVALYIDGVYIPQQRDGVKELEDVELISILKGPQGTLFGRNATAGVVQITTKAPSFDFGGRLRAEIDNYATFRTGGYVTGGLTDNIAASLSASYVTQGNGYGENFTTGRDTYKVDHDISVRGKLLLKIGDGTKVTLSGDYSDSNKRTAHLIPIPGTQLGFANIYATNPLKSVFDTYEGTGSFTKVKGGGGSLTIDHDSGPIRVQSITAYRDIKSSYLFNAIPTPTTLQVVDSPNSPSKSFSQEFQVSSNEPGPLSWIFGLYYFNYDNGARPINRNLGGFVVSPVTRIVQTQTFATENTESVAPFGEFTWELLPDTKLTGGLRYTYERRELKDARVVAINASGATVANTSYGGSLSYSQPTYRIGLNHKFADQLLAYATFNTGFKSGGFNSVSPATPPYQPEKLKAYEVGLKSELFDKRLRLNASGFYYKYTNLQVIQFVNSIQTVTNGPKAEIYGLDVDFEASLFSGLRLSGGFELKHSEFTSYPNAVIGALRPGGIGATLTPGDATGNRLPQAQKFSGTLALDYHHDLSRGSLDFNATANYNGNFYFQADNAVRQAPYTLVNVSLTYNLPGDRISLRVWGKNLADEKFKTAVIETPVGFLGVYTSPPLTFGGGVAIKF